MAIPHSKIGYTSYPYSLLLDVPPERLYCCTGVRVPEGSALRLASPKELRPFAPTPYSRSADAHGEAYSRSADAHGEAYSRSADAHGEAYSLLPIIKMQIQFREFNQFDLWIWIEFTTVPSEMERRYVEEIFNSWFYLGKLGAFNAENLQVQEEGLELSYMNYDQQTADNSLIAVMHNMGEFEYLGTWARCWFDLGTSDGIAIDILLNGLRQLSNEYVSIEALYIGGENADWPVEDSESRPLSIYDDN